MKSFMKSALFAMTVLLFSGASQALVIPLDPALSQTGNFGFTVCDGPGFPSCNATIGPTTTSYNINFLNAGLFSSSITSAITGTGGVFTLLDYDILNPSLVVVASGITAQSNLNVIAGLYTIIVHYTFVGGPNTNSAAISMPLTTGPSLARLPEPGTLLLLGVGLLGAAAIGRRKMN